MTQKNILKLWTTGLGLGLFPKAPGTAGSLLGILLYFFTKDFFPILQLFLLAVYFFASTQFLQKLIKLEKLSHHDQSYFVCDEVIGAWLVCFFAAPTNYWNFFWCFCFFRFFDIWKPFPVSYVDEKIKGGLGIMLDDVVAAIYAILFYFLSSYLYDQYGGLFI